LGTPHAPVRTANSFRSASRTEADDHALIRGGVALVTAALHRHRTGPYLLQAAVAALHDQAFNADTKWAEIASVHLST
jgi:predicted RNA polymerase sigma factor